MASGLSDYLANALLEDFLGSATYTPPATIYYTLAAGAWNPAGITGEFSSGNYARIAVTRNTSNFGVTGRVLSLLADQAGVELNADQASGSPALSWAAFDASTGGNLLFGGDLPAGDQKSYLGNDQLVIKGTATTVTIG